MLSFNRKAECLVEQLSAAIDRCSSSSGFLSLRDKFIHSFSSNFNSPPCSKVFADVFQVRSELWTFFVAQLVIRLQCIQQFGNLHPFLVRPYEGFDSYLIGSHFL